MKGEIRGRSDFAEFAEAIGCDTDDIFAVYPTGNIAYVFYTPKPGEKCYLVPVVRDESGVMGVIAPPKLMPNFFEEMKDRIEKRLTEELGPPDRRKIEDEG